MAVSTLQQFLNLAVSLTVSNKSKTDVSYSLPDDLRRYENVKIKQMQTQRFEIPGGATEYAIPRIDGDDSLILVFASHPISITEINTDNLTHTLRTSFIGFARDRTGAFGAASPPIKYKNDLHTPNYTSTGGGATTPVEIVTVQMVFEA